MPLKSFGDLWELGDAGQEHRVLQVGLSKLKPTGVCYSFISA